MSVLSVSLFGRLDVQVDGQPLPAFESRKVEELFCHLLLNRGRPRWRESLAELLWPQAAANVGRRYLRKALWQLQHAFAPAGLAPFTVEPEWVEVNTATGFELDVSRFEAAFQGAHTLPGQRLTAEMAHSLRQAVDLYRGDLLENRYQDWLLFERERLRLDYIIMLEKLMAYSEAHQDHEAGLDYGLRVLRLDHAHERTHRLLMRFHLMAGRPAAALQQYERCAATLRLELGVEPGPKTVALYQHIRAGSPLPASGPPAALAAPAGAAELHSRLTTLETALDQAQAEVRQLRSLLA